MYIWQYIHCKKYPGVWCCIALCWVICLPQGRSCCGIWWWWHGCSGNVCQMAGGWRAHERVRQVNAGGLADAVFMIRGFIGGWWDLDDSLSCSYKPLYVLYPLLPQWYCTSILLIPHIGFLNVTLLGKNTVILDYVLHIGYYIWIRKRCYISQYQY